MSRPRVVILGGAGAMGRITAQDLISTSGGSVQVVIADRDLGPARDLEAERVSLDMRDPKSVQRAVRDAFAVIASLPYGFNLDAMAGALAARAHYVDLGGLFHMTRKQMELHGAFESAGLMAILGMGSAPGVINVLAVHAARDLKQVREVHCLVGSVDHTRFRDVPPLEFAYSGETLLDEFVMESAVFRNGGFRMVPALDPGERVTVRFPPPVGRLAVDTTLHSEVATLPLSFKDRGVREVTFRQAFEAEFVDKLRFLVRLGLAGTEPLPLAGRSAPPTNGASPRDVLMALVRRFPPATRVGPLARHEVLRALVRGRQDGRDVAVAADCYAGPKTGGGVGPDLNTGAPPSIAVQLMLSGELPIRPGVWAPEQAVPVGALVRELERRGMPVRRRVVRERPGHRGRRSARTARRAPRSAAATRHAR